MALSFLDLEYPTYCAPADVCLKAGEVLEALECLLYLMGAGAATPQQVRAYVQEAKRVLRALDALADQEASPRQYIQ